jgi:hypothetical protein
VAKDLATLVQQIRADARRIAETPLKAIQVGEAVVMADMPVWSGTYKDSVKVTPVTDGYSLHVTEPDLLASAEAHKGDRPIKKAMSAQSYIMENIHGIGPEGPYPLRIEEHGSPVSGMGGQAWRKANAAVKERMRAGVRGTP